MVKPKKYRGSVSVEFSLGIAGFLAMFLFWVEVSYMGYISSVVDLAITEASRDVKNTENADYREKFTQVLQSDDSLWGKFINIDNLSMQTRYYNDIVELAEPCVPTDDSGDDGDDDWDDDDWDDDDWGDGDDDDGGSGGSDSGGRSCDDTGTALNSALAIYTLNYSYTPIFNLFFNLSDDIGLSREVIVIQEYERSEFK
uniref:TadE family protein n=1 Tax=Thaumasiovibrio occultus TaxID=1891184 RepID=UPI000B358A30|nr:TadE family protein [Thaumasiovibrio occultus]